MGALWNDFISQRKSELPEPDKLLVLSDFEPKPMTLRPSKPPEPYRHPKESRCMYDPNDPNYIYRGKAPSQNKKYVYFGYNGNYPENQIHALRVRGCWKFLEY
jgi:hypothetical protein